MGKLINSWKLGIIVVMLGSLLLTACGSSGAKSVTVNLTLSEFSINSSLTTFTQGVTYHFVVKNTGATNHEVYIMPSGGSDMDEQQAKDASLAGLGSADLPSGATKSFDYTFTKAYPAGSLELSCHISGHYDSGMHTPIVVN
jgi:uncharacterized cupredoxin-like copper-binding protein